MIVRVSRPCDPVRPATMRAALLSVMSPGPVAQRSVRSFRARGGAILLFALGYFASRQAALGAVAVAVQLPPAAPQTVDFIKDIQPILAQSCYEDRKSTRLNSSHANISYA